MPTRGTVLFLLIACAAGLIVLGARWSLIERAGNPVPFLDQWYAEAEHLYLPALHGDLTAADFIKPHNEHRIVPTRLLAYALFRANVIWDVRLQMVVNAFLAAALCFPLLALLRAWLPPPGLAAAAALLAWFCAQPILYENALWGFQSQFYFLILFSLLQLALMLGRPALSWSWWLGVTAGGCAIVSMASGVLGCFAVMIASAIRCVLAADTLQRRDARITLAAAAALGGLGWWCLPAGAGAASTFHFQSFAHTVAHALAFPDRLFSLGGLVVWLPFATFVVAVVSRRSVGTLETLVLGSGAWVLLQIIAIGYTRPIVGPVLPNRYYDLLTVGLIVNLAALLWWVRPCGAARRRTSVSLVTALTLMWVGWCGWHARTTARIHREQLEPLFRELRDEQVQRLKVYVRANDVVAVRGAVYPHIPVVDPSSLENLLRLPEIQTILPFEIQRPISLNFPDSPPSLSNALPISVPNEPGMVHRGTYLTPGQAAATAHATSLPARKRPGTRLLFYVAGDLKAGETEIRVHDGRGATVAVITDTKSEQLHPEVVAVSGTVFSVEVLDKSATRWLAFVEPVEVGPWSLRAAQALRAAPYVQYTGWMILVLVFAASIRRPISTVIGHLQRPRP